MRNLPSMDGYDESIWKIQPRSIVISGEFGASYRTFTWMGKGWKVARDRSYNYFIIN